MYAVEVYAAVRRFVFIEGTPLRALNLLAQLGVAPDAIAIEKSNGSYYVSISELRLADGRLAALVEKLRSLIVIQEANFVDDGSDRPT